MSDQPHVDRRGFLGRTLAAAGAAGAASLAGGAAAAETPPPARQPAATTAATGENVPPMPYGMIGDVRLSRMLLGGNLVSGGMHARGLQYVNSLFRAYVNEEKLFETFALAEQYGINTVFESGAAVVNRYNHERGGKLQIIPHIEVRQGESDAELASHIQQQIDTGAVALYVWGVSSDTLAMAGAYEEIGRAVEMAKKHGLPVGVGSHSLKVPVACEKLGVPCDFYVKTLHTDDYPSATLKHLQKDFMWMEKSEGWFDNQWCINAEEVVEFMKTVEKPWIAFKVLAAGAIRPREGFTHAFRSGADFIAVGMFDFQMKQNCELVEQIVRREQSRERPWRA
ncbi:MAG: hypothetical protein ACOY3P_10540 [Planctomycetota bacterium]